jgi:hypothetical protein
VITENWSIIVIEDPSVNFVGEMDNISQQFNSSQAKHSTQLRFCCAFWDAILFSWSPRHQRVAKENEGYKSASSSLFTRFSSTWVTFESLNYTILFPIVETIGTLLKYTRSASEMITPSGRSCIWFLPAENFAYKIQGKLWGWGDLLMPPIHCWRR